MSGNFQHQVNLFQAPGVPGTRASMNVVGTIDAGESALVAGANAFTGAFAWIDSNGQTVETICPTTGLTVPDGFLGNEHQGLIVTFLDTASTQVYQGSPVTLYDRGDFWAQNLFAPATYGQKVFVNKNGQVLGAAAGSFPTVDVSLAGTISSAHIDNGTTQGTVGNVLTVVTGSNLEVGQKIVDSTGYTVGYITALGTGTGGAGTYLLNQNATYPAASAFTVVGETATGAVIASADLSTTTMTVNTITSGKLAVGMFVQGTGIPAGTYISALGTGTGGVGTYTLSQSCSTETGEAVNASGWIETPWYIKSTVNAGDVVKIGVRN